MRTLSGAARRWEGILVAVTSVATSGATAFAQSEPVAPTVDAAVQTRLAEARRHFELGVAHFDRQEWQAALVEFLSSRELAPTRGNTKNAAICLRKVGRFDESLDMFEALLRDFPDLSPADRELAQREIAELLASVGTLEIRDVPPGARVTIDGVDRGTTPLPGPVRLAAGSHTVRIMKDGFMPFETRIDLAGKRAEILRPRLAMLTQAGRLRITEKNGRDVELIVDGSRVGTAPWDGALSPGVHSVWLRGEGTLGTPPAEVVIELGKQIALELVAVPLDSELEVSVEPSSADILVDGILAGRGAWKGRLGTGRHEIDVKLGGYVPFTQALTLAKGERRILPVVLEPTARRARIELELDAGIPVGLLWGGDLMSQCAAPCTSSLPIGVYAQAHATYRFAVGVGVGIHAGYLRMWTNLEHRAESMTVVSTPLPGTADDHLRIAGLMAGAEADYTVGRHWPLTLRVAAGALIGAVTDERTGTFVDSDGASYETSHTLHPRATYFYLGPEVRIGHRIGDHLDVSVGAKTLFFAALTRPSWDGEELINAGENDVGVFAPAPLTGDLVIAVLPGISARYVF
jgi:hypothetical protein